MIKKKNIIKYGKKFLNLLMMKELKLHEKIRLFEINLPIEKIYKIPSITIVIESLIEKENKFYLELVLNHCLYENYKDVRI